MVPVWSGYTVRQHRDHAVAERERAEQVARLAELDHRQAVAAERTRMARELHDVVANHLSVIAIHSTGALALPVGRDGQVREALTVIRENAVEDLKLGLNLAFTRSFSVPSVAALHTPTGELTERTQKRIDDTGLLMYEMILNGFDHPRGREALRRVNQVHRPYAIADDDYLYVLGCLVVIPIRWLDRYGWRRPCCHERRATFVFYRELGKRMNIAGIPDSYEAFEAWFDAFDAEHLRPNDDAAAIERATRMLMLTRVPKVLAPLGNALVSGIYDEPLRRATGVRRPAWPVRAGLHLAFKARARLLRHLGRPRVQAMFADGIKTRSYPDGYEISQLGPEHPVPDPGHPER